MVNNTGLICYQSFYFIQKSYGTTGHQKLILLLLINTSVSETLSANDFKLM